MNDIILPCCGSAVPPPPREISCTGCGSYFTEVQVDGVQMKEINLVPGIDDLGAARMLNQTKDWIVQHEHLLDPIRGALGLRCVFPLTAIRSFATVRSLTITPLPTDGALWISRAR
jgi:hypothetical protein